MDWFFLEWNCFVAIQFFITNMTINCRLKFFIIFCCHFKRSYILIKCRQFLILLLQSLCKIFQRNLRLYIQRVRHNFRCLHFLHDNNTLMEYVFDIFRYTIFLDLAWLNLFFSVIASKSA